MGNMEYTVFIEYEREYKMKNENEMIVIRRSANGKRKYYRVINEAGDMVRIDIKNEK